MQLTFNIMWLLVTMIIHLICATLRKKAGITVTASGYEHLKEVEASLHPWWWWLSLRFGIHLIFLSDQAMIISQGHACEFPGPVWIFTPFRHRFLQGLCVGKCAACLTITCRITTYKSVFCCHDKMPQIKHLRGGKVYFDSQLQRLESFDHVVLGVWWGTESITVGGGFMVKHNCSPHGAQEGERWKEEEEEGRGTEGWREIRGGG